MSKYPVLISLNLIFVVFLAAQFFPISAIAGGGRSFEDGMAVWKTSSYEEAIEIWKALGEKGHADALNNIGVAYRNGLGVEQNYSKALEQFRKGATNGSLESHNSIGQLFDEGWGVDQNFSKALIWYKTAAEHGYAMSQYGVGRMYALGRGVPKNYIIASAWWGLAMQVCTSAQVCNGARQAKDMIAAKMTSEEIETAQQKSSELWDKFGKPFKIKRNYRKDWDKCFSTSRQMMSDCMRGKGWNVVSQIREKPSVMGDKTPLEKAKKQCTELGFTKGTEKHGDCVMKLYK